MNIFEHILKTRSLTHIGYLAEDALPLAANPVEESALKAILETNKLDEAWALSHEQLGQVKEAAILRAHLAKAPPKMDSELEQMLGL